MFYGYHPSSKTIRPITYASEKKSVHKARRTSKVTSLSKLESVLRKSDLSSQTRISQWLRVPPPKTKRTAKKKEILPNLEVLRAAQANGLISKN